MNHNFKNIFYLVLHELIFKYKIKEIENKFLTLKEKIKQLENEFYFLDETVIEKYKKIEKIEKEIEQLQEQRINIEMEFYVNFM